MTKNRSMPAIGDILRSALEGVCPPGRTELLDIISVWNNTLGSNLAEKTCPAALRRGVLVVHVVNSVWAQELQFLKDSILDRLKTILPDAGIDDIRFAVGTVKTAWPRSDALSPPPLNPGEQEAIQSEASVIEDRDLQDAFAQLMKAYVQNKKR